MALTAVYHRIRTAPAFDEVVSWIKARKAGQPSVLQVKNAIGSLPAFVLLDAAERTERPLVCVFPTEEAASYFTSDLEQVSGEASSIVRFPASGVTPYDPETVDDPGPLIQRTDALTQLIEGRVSLLVTSAEAVYEMLPPPDAVKTEALVLATGQGIALEELVARLTEQGFERTEFVAQPGDMAIRGGILDVYPYTGDYPVRVEFFGDEIDSIREFDPKTQRSVSRLTTARVVPNLEAEADLSGLVHDAIFAYLPDETVFVIFQGDDVQGEIRSRYEKAVAEYERRRSENGGMRQVPPTERYLDDARLLGELAQYDRILFGISSDESPDTRIQFDARPQPSFNSSIEQLRKRLWENKARGQETFILCDSSGQQNRLRELLEDDAEPPVSRLLVESLHEGFELPETGLAVYTDHQIFNRYHRPTARKRRRQMGGMSVRDLKALEPGDFVVHVDYGIGKFAGMQKITVRDKIQEAVRVLFADNDMLYVNVNALYKLSKYSGRDGHQPRLTKLGSGQWERTKAKTKKRLKDIARDLIQLYARRKSSSGHAFPPDSIWQRELEASFEWEDTPDQATTTEAVKQDMEMPVPMDRLVCGDVGFGKTEIAVRAAFKAVQDGKQVAVLVPTTILADQHYSTFKKRLSPYPVRIEVLSRFVTPEVQKDVIKRAAKGEVDILIGTHRIASKDIKLKELGLLVIDEEQRFGVGVKEKLRQMRAEVDTLTLTATPIPRTLQFSLLGARDLSIISTPPPNRQPIFTEIHTFDKDLIRDAILYEVTRGGQVFFIHNRVNNILEVGAMVRELVPNIRVRVGHGQMTGKELESVMTDFVDKKFEVLVSTNIIESGLDISNANTIIVNNAGMFGLSELHQLRGRVGRSDRKAFCYLLVPSVHTLTREAKQRLQAVEEFSELGSGFNIAMRDLDIRGAGNLLGAEQTGFIDDVGFETYHKILDEAVTELRVEEFAEVFGDDVAPRPSDTQIDVEEDAIIPVEYVANNVERLNVYRQISEAATDAQLEEAREEMADRFGPVPAEVDALLLATRLKLRAQMLRLSRITLKNKRLFLEMPTQDSDPYFYERVFHPTLERLSKLKNRYVIRETDSRLKAIVQDVPDLNAAMGILEHIVPADALAPVAANGEEKTNGAAPRKEMA